MRYRGLACDYDGTLAHNGTVGEEVVLALQRCRDSGRSLLMVTGRELRDLKASFGHLDLFHYIVAENGATLFSPTTGEEWPLAAAPPDSFAQSLRTRGVQPLAVGQVILATWSPHETIVLKTIHDLGLELQVIFNKGAVMVLPSGVNKATGLKVALDRLGLAPEEIVAIGDAENDHALLDSAGLGIAVANAVPMLLERADLVTRSDHGQGVVELIGLLLENDLAGIQRRDRLAAQPRSAVVKPPQT